jgi:hypothetical protein
MSWNVLVAAAQGAERGGAAGAIVEMPSSASEPLRIAGNQLRMVKSSPVCMPRPAGAAPHGDHLVLVEQ